MLSKRNNELLTRVGPGTPMGELFRRYWIPALISEEIPEPDCPPARVRLLGEDLVAFRDSEGRIGLIAERCSHRQASLYFGRNEECGLRCVYHGWKYDVEGKVVDTPAEPAASRLKQRIHHPAYPTREVNGVVFAYMGPADKMPVVPNYDWLTLPASHVGVTKFRLDCNYLQALEGDCDTSHASFLHRGNQSQGLAPPDDEMPLYTVEPTWCGLKATALRSAGPDRVTAAVGTFGMPFVATVATGQMTDGEIDGYLAVYQVPADDEHTTRYNFRFLRSRSIDDPWLIGHDSCQVGPDYQFIANAQNGWLIDRADQRTRSYTGIEGTTTQDAAVTWSMGPIMDRSRENLGVSDIYVLALRKYLLDAVKRNRPGSDPPGVVFDSASNDYSAVRSTRTFIAGEAKERLWRRPRGRLAELPTPVRTA